jgi:hypothetical protein
MNLITIISLVTVFLVWVRLANVVHLRLVLWWALLLSTAAFGK